MLDTFCKVKADDLGCCQVAAMVNGVKVNQKSRDMVLKDLFAKDQAPKKAKSSHMESTRRVGIQVNNGDVTTHYL